jgi:hypothetical protein
MKRYYVKVQVNYDGDIEANSPEEAEEKAWHSYYGDDAILTYDSVDSIDVDEYDVCDVCDKDVEEYCECEDEEESEDND